MRKLIRNLERNDAYENDSDDDKNPYASSEGEEEEEETPMVQDGPAIQPQDQKQALAAGLDIKPSIVDGAATATATANDANANGTPQPGSRAASPAAPSLGGHLVVAKRATSPKAPRLKGQNVSSGSRATSPLAGAAGSRATSPAASNSRAGSPMAQKTPTQNKRKADEASGANSPPPASGSGGLPKKKKIKPTQGVSGADGPMTAKMLADYLRSTENPTTRACIQYFNSYIKQGPEAKSLFTDLVKEVAVLKDGVLILRPQWANASL
jgi:transcription initiation factor TFIIF subunit alpha